MAPVSGVRIARPAPIKLYDAPWTACGKKVCLTPRQVARTQENQVKVGGWMREANTVMDYYETGVTPAPAEPE